MLRTPILSNVRPRTISGNDLSVRLVDGCVNLASASGVCGAVSPWLVARTTVGTTGQYTHGGISISLFGGRQGAPLHPIYRTRAIYGSIVHSCSRGVVYGTVLCLATV
jgi:hypothetical protein